MFSCEFIRCTLQKLKFYRNSLNVTNTSLLASPSVTTVFSSLHHAIESYETSIPVLVTEAIALSEGKEP